MIGEVSTDASIDVDNPTVGNRQWITYVDIAKQNPAYPTETTIFDAFWQTLVAGKDGPGSAKAHGEYSKVFSLIIDSSTGSMPSLPGQMYSVWRQKGFFTLDSLRSRKSAKALRDIRKTFRAALQMRWFAVIEREYFALIPRGAVIGDKVAIFKDVNEPFILRSMEDKERFQLVGEGYVYEIMEGQAINIDNIPTVPILLVWVDSIKGKVLDLPPNTYAFFY
jgi:hypothetical protein